MQTQTSIANRATPEASDTAGLYRLSFVGGPFDGHQECSQILPDHAFQIRSGPDGCGTRVGQAIVPRVARYRLASVRLMMSWQEPIVLCRFEFSGTVTAAPSRLRSWWSHGREMLRRWLLAPQNHRTVDESGKRAFYAPG